MKKMKLAGVFFLFGLFLTTTATTTEEPKQEVSEYCMYYSEEDCYGKQNCVPLTYKLKCESSMTFCFVVWEYNNVTEETNIKTKGCFTDVAPSCRTHENRLQLVVCTCSGSLCNQNYSFPGFNETKIVAESREKLVQLPDVVPEEKSDGFTVFAVTITTTPGIGVVLAVICFAGYVRWKRSKKTPVQESNGVSLIRSASDIQLSSVLSTGQFGAIWRGQHLGAEVAVKIYTAENKQLWMNESQVYKLLRINEHTNIVLLLGYLEVKKIDRVEYWTVTEYCEQGSLYHYMTKNFITWEQGLRFACCIISGLDYLHNNDSKAPIAHRDIKSSNVVVKPDMTAAITDFNLALILEDANIRREFHDRVGTLRYMAPEVLDGAINFNKISFERIDIYAYALVLWEIITRCRDVLDDESPQYQLPFEVDVGMEPTLATMLETVVHNKIRPNIPQKWRQHLGISQVLQTMEDCWDHDAEARLSSACVFDRLSQLMNPKPERNSGIIDLTVVIEHVASTSPLESGPTCEVTMVPTNINNREASHDEMVVYGSVSSTSNTDEVMVPTDVDDQDSLDEVVVYESVQYYSNTEEVVPTDIDDQDSHDQIVVYESVQYNRNTEEVMMVSTGIDYQDSQDEIVVYESVQYNSNTEEVMMLPTNIDSQEASQDEIVVYGSVSSISNTDEVMVPTDVDDQDSYDEIVVYESVQYNSNTEEMLTGTSSASGVGTDDSDVEVWL